MKRQTQYDSDDDLWNFHIPILAINKMKNYKNFDQFEEQCFDKPIYEEKYYDTSDDDHYEPNEVYDPYMYYRVRDVPLIGAPGQPPPDAN